MLNSTFASLYDSTVGITLQVFLICVGAALALGALMALVYCFRTAHSSSFVVTLALLPATVAVVIMMVNGNLGAGMCGGCRVTVGGETKFACVDGPEFDGHKVDFAELMKRNSVYRDREAEVKENHACRMDAMGKALIK